MSKEYFVEFDREVGVDFEGDQIVRYRIVELGHSAMGWEFLFREQLVTDYFCMGRTGSIELSSVDDWREFVLNGNGHIVDDYGVHFTWPEFMNMVKAKMDGINRRSDTYSEVYRDHDGYAFEKWR